jgi:hypothetical protein
VFFIRKLVDGTQQPRQIVERNFITAAQIRLEVRHQQCAGNPLPGDIGKHKSHMGRAEIHEVVIIPAYLSRLQAASSILDVKTENMAGGGSGHSLGRSAAAGGTKTGLDRQWRGFSRAPHRDIH